MTDDIRQQFAAAAEEYAQRLRDERERRENPGKARTDAADKFAAHLEQQINEQRANGMRLTLENL